MSPTNATPAARAISDTLAAMPGSSTRAVARALGVDESTADYHLRRLRRRGDVVAQAHGRELAWFLSGSGLCPVLKRAVPAMRREEVLATARALDETPASARIVAERAGVPVGAVRWAAGVLEEAGLLERSRSGRLALRRGADVCIRRAAEGARCELWGRCEVSRALEAQVGPGRNEAAAEASWRTLTLASRGPSSPAGPRA